MDSKERTDVLGIIAETVARLLTSTSKSWNLNSGTWTFTPPIEDRYQVDITRADGAKLYFTLGSSVGYDKNDRVTVSGGLHIGVRGEFVNVYEGGIRQTGGEISVARARGCEAIAKEIARRLLPEYLRIFELAKAQVAKWSEYEQATIVNLQRLANASGNVIPADKDDYRREARTSYSLSIGEIYGTVYANDKTAQLELRCLTVTQAEHILGYLKTEMLVLKNERTAKESK